MSCSLVVFRNVKGLGDRRVLYPRLDGEIEWSEESFKMEGMEKMGCFVYIAYMVTRENS